MVRNERGDRAEEFPDACEEIDRFPNARKLNYSFIATMAIYSDEQILSRLTIWRLWRQHWVYQTPCTAVLPIAMPLRPVAHGNPSGNAPSTINDEIRAALFVEEDDIEESGDLWPDTQSLRTQRSDSGPITSSIDDVHSGGATMDLD